MSDAQFKRIKEKLKKTNPVITQKELDEFRNKYNIELPENVKRFLLEIGNGCEIEKDVEEIYDLATITDRLDSMIKNKTLELKELQKPFPFKKQSYPKDVESEGIFHQMTERGNIPIGHSRLGHAYCLIIVGPEKGKIWGIDDDQAAPQKEFLDWLEEELDS